MPGGHELTLPPTLKSNMKMPNPMRPIPGPFRTHTQGMTHLYAYATNEAKGAYIGRQQQIF